MKKSYVIPRTTSVEVVTENGFAVWLSKVTGTGTFSDESTAINIGDGGSNSSDDAPPPTAKGGFWDI
ncbi:MAG: hypothetical protein IIU48_07120 [Prevotella sp.]|nr:hypothetical protein [Prevotella sp.]MBQ4210871.1 hypothetical protein [Prevotella sp.]MBQ5378274.1 hypothetical protein [Prevotella sp.]